MGNYVRITSDISIDIMPLTNTLSSMEFYHFLTRKAGEGEQKLSAGQQNNPPIVFITSPPLCENAVHAAVVKGGYDNLTLKKDRVCLFWYRT